MSILEPHRRGLGRLAERHRLRQLVPARGFDFSSNDYLGLAASQELAEAVRDALERGVPTGAGGSRLLRGNHEQHELLEREAASFFGSESALFFSSGFAANAALLSTLPRAGDLIVHDSLIHASAHEGMRLGKAEARAARHNDAAAFEDRIRAWREEGGRGRPWIVVESLYSMDGDVAPVDDLAAVAERHDAFLVIDEAHATGVAGDRGKGLAAHLEGRENVLTVRTCGKALGCEGALICSADVLKQALINRGRGFIFSTAPSPLMAAAVRAALRLIDRQPERRERLKGLVDAASRLLQPIGATITGTQIIPLLTGDDSRALILAEQLQHRGFDIRAIRPPTVPIGTARLRISITLNVDEQAVGALAAALRESVQ